jgi:hypothetical protein
MSTISHRQFHDLASRLSEPDEGYTVNLSSGHQPSSGYIVSQPGHERRYPAGANVGGRELASHAKEHQAELRRPGRYLGGWHDPITGNKDLDVSRHYANHGRAVKAMWANDQDAMYNMNDWRSEHNFEKLGTAGTAISHIVHEGPDPMAGLQFRQMASASLRGAKAAPPEFLRRHGRR